MKEGEVTKLVLLDFSQVFDTVVHKLLLTKLQCEKKYFSSSKMLVLIIDSKW
jgi:hypothetical protein